MSDSRRPAWFPAILFALLACAAGAWGYIEHRQLARLEFIEHRLALLESENDSLRAAISGHEKAAARTAEAALRKPVEQAVEKIRGLNFTHPVTYDVLTHDGIRGVLEQKITQLYSDRDFKNFSDGLAAFGLVEQDYPLKEKFLSLLGEQVAAFYDQHQHKLFMFEDASLEKTQNRIVLAHELTHALQDQHYNLLRMPLETKDNDDLVMATSALVEGDATVTMSDYMMQNFSLKDLREDFSGVFSTGMGQLQKAPRYLRESLVFPYLRGQQFCEALRDRGGYAAISAAYSDPPISTSQILHPEKYFAREQPVRIEWSDTTALGRKPDYDNVLGEFVIRILFTQWVDEATGKEASEGWRGDRYLAFDDGKALVWKTAWDNEAKAGRFREDLRKYVSARFPHAVFDAGNPGDAGRVTFSSPTASGGIMLTGSNEVLFVWAQRKEMRDALEEKFK